MYLARNGSQTISVPMETQLMLCDSLEGWDGLGGRFGRKEACVYPWLMGAGEQQKPTQHCKQFTFN